MLILDHFCTQGAKSIGEPHGYTLRTHGPGSVSNVNTFGEAASHVWQQDSAGIGLVVFTVGTTAVAPVVWVGFVLATRWMSWTKPMVHEFYGFVHLDVLLCAVWISSDVITALSTGTPLEKLRPQLTMEGQTALLLGCSLPVLTLLLSTATQREPNYREQYGSL